MSAFGIQPRKQSKFIHTRSISRPEVVIRCNSYAFGMYSVLNLHSNIAYEIYVSSELSSCSFSKYVNGEFHPAVQVTGQAAVLRIQNLLRL